jgi:hypothetical protein
MIGMRVGNPVLMETNLNGYIIALIGLVASATGVYIAASFNLAQKQLLAATRLQAYLRHWGQWVLDVGVFNVFYLGQEWDKEEQQVILSGGGPKGLVALREEKQKLCSQIVDKLKDQDLYSHIDLAALRESITRLPKDTVPSLLDSVKTGRQNLITGQTFITDEEGACLGIAVAQSGIAFKMGVIELLDGLSSSIVKAISQQDGLDPKNHIEDARKLLWRSMTVSKDHCRLLRYAESFTTRTVLELTLRNIRSGSRISKR